MGLAFTTWADGVFLIENGGEFAWNDARLDVVSAVFPDLHAVRVHRLNIVCQALHRIWYDAPGEHFSIALASVVLSF